MGRSCVLRQGPTLSLPARELLVRTQFFETLAAGISSSWFIACSDSRKKCRVQPCLNSHISTTFYDHHAIPVYKAMFSLAKGLIWFTHLGITTWFIQHLSRHARCAGGRWHTPRTLLHHHFLSIQQARGAHSGRYQRCERQLQTEHPGQIRGDVTISFKAGTEHLSWRQSRCPAASWNNSLICVNLPAEHSSVIQYHVKTDKK